MMSDEEDIVCTAAAACILLEDERRKIKGKRWWMTSLFRSRDQYGGSKLMLDLKAEMEYGLFHNFFRMKASDFEFLLNRVGPKISKQDTSFRRAIPAAERLMVTLRYLATGDSYASLMYTFKMSKQVISKIVPEVCFAIAASLQEYVVMPSTPDEWMEVAEVFDKKWNFPHCLGAIDGRHCSIQAPMYTGSEYFNYKQNFSIVLLGVADADYRFLFADAGSQGRISDGGVLKNSRLWKLLENDALNLPPEKALQNRQMKMPFFFVGDDAFALHENLMKGYPAEQKKGSMKRIYNYRLSRARRVIENVFGIMSSVFRVLRKPMLLTPERAASVVMAYVYLHSFLRKSKASRNIYTPPGTFDDTNEATTIPGAWRTENQNGSEQSFISLSRIGRKPSPKNERIRNELAEYFTCEGRVDWQDDSA